MLAGRWLAKRREKLHAGALSVSGAAQSKYRIEHFTTFIGAEAGIETVNADRWESWYNHLLGAVNKGEMSHDWARNLWQTSRQFLQWAEEVEALPRLPKNFGRLKFKGAPPKDITVFAVPDVKAMLAAATPPVRLYLCLMLNTGCYQSDISDLRRDEVDLEKGTITRRRTKTKGKGDVPTVCYKLWGETLALLRMYISADGDFALLNEDGQQLVRMRLKDDGTDSKTDSIRLAFDRLRAKVGVAGSIKVFRKTSASLLNKDPRFRGIVSYFLGHSPRTIAEKHYARESDELLAEAVKYLGQVYGVD